MSNPNQTFPSRRKVIVTGKRPPSISSCWTSPVLRSIQTRWRRSAPTRVSEGPRPSRSEEHTSELLSPFLISYAVFCLKKKKHTSELQSPFLISYAVFCLKKKKHNKKKKKKKKNNNKMKK